VPIVILEAMLEVGEALRPLDLRRATTLARMAVAFAGLSPVEGHRMMAKNLLNGCLGRS
jgi:hypothetical protein